MDNHYQRSNQVDKIIDNHVIYSIGGGLIPISILDIAAVTGIQLNMIQQIANVYGENFSEVRAKSWISALSGSILAKIGASFIKLIPGIGSIIGGVSMAALSGGSTYAIGQVMKKHFSSGGSALTFDPESYKTYFQEQFERGKEFAESLRNQKDKEENAKSNESNEILERLKELKDLHEAGALSDEEFTQFKAKLIDIYK